MMMLLAEMQVIVHKMMEAEKTPQITFTGIQAWGFIVKGMSCITSL